MSAMQYDRDFLAAGFFVSLSAMKEIKDWSKEQIIAYLIMCQMSDADYDYEILHGRLEAQGMNPETFFSALRAIGIDYAEEKRRRDASNQYWHDRLRQREEKERFVYLVRNPESGLLKIGFTCDLERRFKQIAQGQWWEVEVITTFPSKRASTIEAEFKRAFSAYHHKGEWFSMSEAEALGFLDSARGGK